jgi:hypothetical protein
MPPAVRSATVAALALALLAGCGGGGDKTVAHVGGDGISQKQLDSLVAHFRTEAQREGREFPRHGTRGYDGLRDQLLGLLVYRAELQQAANRVGVEVDPSEVTRRLAAAQGGEEEGDAGGDTFARDSVETQLLLEAISAKVTRGVTGAARRNEKMAAYLARLKRDTTVRYEPGYAPGS